MTETIVRHSRAYGQITGMVKTQNALNSNSYGAAWLASGGLNDSLPEVWDYPLAAAQELSEFLNSWGYGWWGVKEFPHVAPVDKMNCMTELVDAWHFIMSQAIIEEDGDLERAARALLNGYATAFEYPPTDRSHRSTVVRAKQLMSMLADYADHPTLNISKLYVSFFDLLFCAGFSLDHFATRYTAKALLNEFRQLNGYTGKPRTYKKNWEEGREDNYFVASFVDESFSAYNAGIDARMPSKGEIMRWIGVTYTNKTGLVAVLPLIEDEAGDE
jgi:hypothetical protein